MNWGYKIMVVYAVFVAGIAFLVYKSATQKMDLVTTDYYSKELKYQQKIDQTSRVAALSDSVRFTIKDQQLTILFPRDFLGRKLSGEVILYCPSDENRDLKQNFSSQNTSIPISISSAKNGAYEIDLSWHTEDGADYYLERKIFI